MPSTSDWDKVKESLQGEPTPEQLKKAGEAVKTWQGGSKQNSKPVLCSLGGGTSYPKAIPLEKLGDEISKNQELFKAMQKVVGAKS